MLGIRLTGSIQPKALCKFLSCRSFRHPERHTLLTLPHPTIIPGDRFREVYYWDSYWVIRGLLVSGMYATALGMVNNLLHLVDTYGFVPNGTRTYYLNRTQPPLLSEMVKVVYLHKKDSTLLRRAIPLLIKEHSNFISKPREVRVKDKRGRVHSLARYWANTTDPRPESFFEDFNLASGLSSELAASSLLQNIASAAESGWDFSSRWMQDPPPPSSSSTSPPSQSQSNDGGVASTGYPSGTPPHSLLRTRTAGMVPADLNAFLFQMENNIAFFIDEAQTPPTTNPLIQDTLELADSADIINTETAHKFRNFAAARLEAINSILWDPDRNSWCDFVLREDDNLFLVASSCRCLAEEEEEEEVWWSGQQSTAVCASNYTPLWCGCARPHTPMAATVLESLKTSRLLLPGGVATTLQHTGEQWDFPNAWPPLQYIIIQGLARYGGADGAVLAEQIAHRWISTNLQAFKYSGAMHEKYDARSVGESGRGGEYVPQVGFGWSNGVLLVMLHEYGHNWSSL